MTPLATGLVWGVIVLVVGLIVIWCSCVVAGRADDETEAMHELSER